MAKRSYILNVILVAGVVSLVCVAASYAQYGSGPAKDGSGQGPAKDNKQKHEQMMKKKMDGCCGMISQAVSVLYPTQGNTTKGVVRFSQVEDGVKVVADIEGLTPNSKHGFHIHEYGDCRSPDGTAAGGHYNPQGHQHGLLDTAPRHAGDLGNVEADAQGHAHYEITVDNISVCGPLNPILGRGVIVHANPDDGSQPTGNAGGRIAHGVIGIANPQSQ